MSTLLDLRGRVALITGGGRGIGRAIGALLEDLGARVFLNYSNSDAKPAASEWPEELLIEGDVASPSACRSMLRVLESRAERLDILVNNAGVFPRATVDEVTEAQWDLVQSVNLKGAFFSTQAALGLLRRSSNGRVVNIASVAATSGSVLGAHYSASKAGLVGLTKSLARSLGPDGILVNAVAPGMTDTTQPIESQEERELIGQTLPLGRIAQPVDVARVVAFLVSELGSYVTGQVIYLHGGVMKGV